MRGALNVAGAYIGGRYRLEALLGRGGMGEVWRAYDSRLERKVAIKFLPPHLADGQVVDRFHREARVTARLQHAGITQVFDSGAQDGQLHLVMELLDGRNLGAVLQEQPSGLPVHRAVDLGRLFRILPGPARPARHLAALSGHSSTSSTRVPLRLAMHRTGRPGLIRQDPKETA
ncbi:protein kinase domain-containing protein [Streptomyces nojiriensis]|uniref:protein kinase domain-containing protein n=1 Tax=Streptomyces nojiriensis TaxID=66374 RepID=UPI0036501676